MFTYNRPKKNAQPVFHIDNKPVYAIFKKDHTQRIKPFRKTEDYLSSDEFMERYQLSKRESLELKKAIRSNIPPDNNLKKKFYRIRKSLNDRLFTEIDLRGTDHVIRWKYPDDVKAWSGTTITIGSSGVGKTYKIVKEIEEALRRKKKRKFLYISPEFNHDDTLKKLRNSKRYEKYFTGLDVSDEAFEDSQYSNADEWWDQGIHPILKALEPGTKIILDDAPDCLVHNYLRLFLIKYLRTGRHKKIGITSIQHNVRGKNWTSQSYSSVKYVDLFPRGAGKGKITDWLYENLGVGRRRGRELVELFGENGRYMTIHTFSPSVIFGEKYALWV